MDGFLLSDVEVFWKNKEFLAKGKRGFVYVSSIADKKVLIKTVNLSSEASGTILKESKNNEFLNSIGIGPRFFYYDEKRDFMIREFVEGVRVFDWFENNKKVSSFKKNLLFLIHDVFNQCRRMDVFGFNKYEMTNPYKDLLITDDLRVFIIDFERCRFTNKPKNVTQFCQFLVKGKMRSLLDDVGVFLDREKISFLAENYKKSLNDESFNEIKEEIGKAFL